MFEHCTHDRTICLLDKTLTGRLCVFEGNCKGIQRICYSVGKWGECLDKNKTEEEEGLIGSFSSCAKCHFSNTRTNNVILKANKTHRHHRTAYGKQHGRTIIYQLADSQFHEVTYFSWQHWHFKIHTVQMVVLASTDLFKYNNACTHTSIKRRHGCLKRSQFMPPPPFLAPVAVWL